MDRSNTRDQEILTYITRRLSDSPVMLNYIGLFMGVVRRCLRGTAACKGP